MKLSVVIPVYNEAEVLEELTRRARAAALACGVNAEVLVVDDASTDATAAMAGRLSDGVVRFVRLAENRGQTGATLEGVARARGRVVVVLDGDLQDPPEVIPALYAALRDDPVAAVAYAVKRERREDVPARAAFALYHGLQRAFGACDVPLGAGSFCAFRARARHALLDGPRSRANLATLLARQGMASVSVSYTKERRAAGDSPRRRAGALPRGARLPRRDRRPRQRRARRRRRVDGREARYSRLPGVAPATRCSRRPSAASPRSPSRPPTSAASPLARGGRGAGAVSPLSLLALVAAALALGLACARVALGGARGRWAIAAFALLGAVGGLAAPLAGAVVEHDLTVLHEGGSMRTLQAIFGQDGHVGWLWRDAAGALRWDENELLIVALVRLNIALAALSAAALAVVASVAAEHAAAGAVARPPRRLAGLLERRLLRDPGPRRVVRLRRRGPRVEDPRRGARPPAAPAPPRVRLAGGVRRAGGGRPRRVHRLRRALRGPRARHPPPGGRGLDEAYERVRGAAVRVLHAPLPLRVAIVCAAVVLASVGTRFGFHARLALSAAFSTLSLQAPVALLAVTPLPWWR